MIPIYSRSILILSSHLRLGLPKGLFSVKILKAFLLSSILTTCPVCINLIDLITVTILGERYKLWNFSLWMAGCKIYVSVFMLFYLPLGFERKIRPSDTEVRCKYIEQGLTYILSGVLSSGLEDWLEANQLTECEHVCKRNPILEMELIIWHDQ